jgi:hypothetical protein
MGGLFFVEHFVQGVQKTDDGTGIQTLRIDSRVLDKRIVGTINERVSVEKKQLVHVFIFNFCVKLRKNFPYTELFH